MSTAQEERDKTTTLVRILQRAYREMENNDSDKKSDESKLRQVMALNNSRQID